MNDVASYLTRRTRVSVAKLRQFGASQASARNIVRNPEDHEFVTNLLALRSKAVETLGVEHAETVEKMVVEFLRATSASRSSFIRYVLDSDTPSPNAALALMQAA